MNTSRVQTVIKLCLKNEISVFFNKGFYNKEYQNVTE